MLGRPCVNKLKRVGANQKCFNTLSICEPDHRSLYKNKTYFILILFVYLLCFQMLHILVLLNSLFNVLKYIDKRIKSLYIKIVDKHFIFRGLDGRAV